MLTNLPHSQLQFKRIALAESVKRGHNLERANATHMQKYAEMTRKTEVLDKVGRSTLELI